MREQIRSFPNVPVSMGTRIFLTAPSFSPLGTLPMLSKTDLTFPFHAVVVRKVREQYVQVSLWEFRTYTRRRRKPSISPYKWPKFELKMGRNRGARGGRSGGGGHPFFSTHNGGGGASATNGFTFTDIDDEPKFVELPDDFETDSGEETTKSTKYIGLLFQQMIHIFAKKC